MSAIFWIIIFSPIYFVFRPNPYWPLVASRNRACLVLAASVSIGSVLMVIGLATGVVQPNLGPMNFAPPPAPPSVAPSASAAAHWSFREGREYGYLVPLSDDDIKAGKVLADTVMFKYLGEKDGLYSVSTQQGGATVTSSCANPCTAVQVQSATEPGVTSKTVAFDGRKAVDLALIDAMSGRLMIYRPVDAPPVPK